VSNVNKQWSAVKENNRAARCIVDGLNFGVNKMSTILTAC